MAVSSRITSEAVQLGLISSEEKDIYAFTLTSMAFSALTWGTLILMGCFFKCLLGCIAFLVLYLPLRIFAGGYHCNNRRNCYVLSVFIFASMMIMFKNQHYMPSAYHDLIYIIAAIGIFIMAPIQDRNKPMTRAESKHHQGIARKILIVEFVVILFTQFFFGEYISNELLFFTSAPLKLLIIQLMIGKSKNHRMMFNSK